MYRHSRVDDILGNLLKDHVYHKFIEDVELVLLENMFAGDKVPRRYITSNIVSKYSLQHKSPNLYVYDLSGGHRACYIIGPCQEGPGPAPYVIDIMTHDDYNKLFGYTIK